jgi:cytidylate kinase
VIVAIDGPAGSGKSTTARRVAERVGWLYLDTGAMYRAAGLAFLREGAPFTDEAAARLLPATTVDLAPRGPDLRVLLNGEDVTAAIRTPEVSRAASHAAALAPVRARLVEAQRRIARREVAAGRGAVLEGRDIGTVVFPDADVKFFLTADLDARARRRHAEFTARAGTADAPALDVVSEDLDERDRRDADRALAPLRPAPDAVVLDTTALTIEEQVACVLDAIRARGGPRPAQAPA